MCICIYDKKNKCICIYEPFWLKPFWLKFDSWLKPFPSQAFSYLTHLSAHIHTHGFWTAVTGFGARQLDAVSGFGEASGRGYWILDVVTGFGEASGRSFWILLLGPPLKSWAIAQPQSEGKVRQPLREPGGFCRQLSKGAKAARINTYQL